MQYAQLGGCKANKEILVPYGCKPLKSIDDRGEMSARAGISLECEETVLEVCKAEG